MVFNLTWSDLPVDFNVCSEFVKHSSLKSQRSLGSTRIRVCAHVPHCLKKTKYYPHHHPQQTNLMSPSLRKFEPKILNNPLLLLKPPRMPRMQCNAYNSHDNPHTTNASSLLSLPPKLNMYMVYVWNPSNTCITLFKSIIMLYGIDTILRNTHRYFPHSDC